MSTKNWIGTGAQGAAGSLRIVRNSDGWILDASNDTFIDPLSVVSEYYTPTEDTANLGTYSWTLAGANWGTDTYRWYWYASANGVGDVVVSAMTLEADEEPVAETSINQQDVRDAMKLAPSAGAAAAGSIDAKLTDTLADTNELQLDWTNGGRLDLLLDTAAAGGGGGGVGDGDTAFTWTEYQSGHNGDSNYVVPDVTVRVFTNNQGIGTPEASGKTDETGSILFNLNEGTYYLFRRKSGRNFTNPVTVEVG